MMSHLIESDKRADKPLLFFFIMTKEQFCDGHKEYVTNCVKEVVNSKGNFLAFDLVSSFLLKKNKKNNLSDCVPAALLVTELASTA